MDEVKTVLPVPAPFPFPVPLIGGTGKTGKHGVPENPVFGNFGKNRKTCECSERLEALGIILAKVSRLADAALRRLSPESRADAFREVRECTP